MIKAFTADGGDGAPLGTVPQPLLVGGGAGNAGDAAYDLLLMVLVVSPEHQILNAFDGHDARSGDAALGPVESKKEDN